MYSEIMKRLVVMLGIVVAILCFTFNMIMGADFFHSAFMALCVMFAASSIIMVAFQAVSQVLFKHLAERQRVKKMMHDNEIRERTK